MKLLLALIAFASLQTAFAQEYTALEEGDHSLSAADAKITSVKPMCPRNPNGMSCMAFGSMVKVKIALYSCVDSFGGYFSSFEVVNGKGVLSVGAININNERAASVRCYAPSFKSVSIYVPFEGKISVENMEYRGSIIPAL